MEKHRGFICTPSTLTTKYGYQEDSPRVLLAPGEAKRRLDEPQLTPPVLLRQ